MYLITLSNLNQTVQPNQLQKPSRVPNYLQQHLQLLVKQILMGLPVEPILNNYPQLEEWVNELKELSPEKLQLIVLALHPTQRAQKVKFAWDTKQHRQTRKWLQTQIHSQTISEFVSFGYALGAKPESIATAINLDEIDEITL